MLRKRFYKKKFLVQFFFFLSFCVCLFFHRNYQFKKQQGKVEAILIPVYHFHPLKQWDICLQMCIWDLNLVFSIGRNVINRLLLNEIHGKSEFDQMSIAFYLLIGWNYQFFSGKLDLSLHQKQPYYYNPNK